VLRSSNFSIKEFCYKGKKSISSSAQ